MSSHTHYVCRSKHNGARPSAEIRPSVRLRWALEEPEGPQGQGRDKLLALGVVSTRWASI